LGVGGGSAGGGGFAAAGAGVFALEALDVVVEGGLGDAQVAGDAGDGAAGGEGGEDVVVLLGQEGAVAAPGAGLLLCGDVVGAGDLVAVEEAAGDVEDELVPAVAGREVDVEDAVADVAGGLEGRGKESGEGGERCRGVRCRGVGGGGRGNPPPCPPPSRRG